MKMQAWAAVVCLGLVCAGSPRASSPIIITVDASKTIGPYTPVWNYFGADEPNYTYSPDGQKLLGELSALSPVPVYFRTHNLLTTGDGSSSLKWGSTNAYRENPDGSPIYDWTITDRIFDALTQAHVRPLVEAGFMPQALSTHPVPYRHSFPNGDVFTGWSYPPKDYAKWSDLISAWVRHLHSRYGAQTDGWLWEVWNEPDIAYWHGTPEEYDKLYDVTAAAIRGVLPEAKIGGPDSTGPANDHAAAFLRQFLDHCAHGVNAATGGTGTPLDFISFHPKGSPKFMPASAGDPGGHIRMNAGAQLRSVRRGMEIVASYPEWKRTPIILGESDPEGCAACKGLQNGYRNGPLYGVSVAEATMRSYQLARQEKVTLQGAVTWAFEFEDQPYFAGFRELATNGIDKPVLNVFRMMGMLGGDWLPVTSSGGRPLDEVVNDSVTGEADVNAVATRRSRELDVLLWNYHDDDLAASPAAVELHVRGLPRGKLQAELFRMDEDHGNSYTAWQRLGSPQSPNVEQIREIQSQGALKSTSVEVERAQKDGKMRHGNMQNGDMQNGDMQNGDRYVGFDLPRQGVYLLHIKW